MLTLDWQWLTVHTKENKTTVVLVHTYTTGWKHNTTPRRRHARYVLSVSVTHHSQSASKAESADLIWFDQKLSPKNYEAIFYFTLLYVHYISTLTCSSTNILKYCEVTASRTYLISKWAALLQRKMWRNTTINALFGWLSTMKFTMSPSS